MVIIKMFQYIQILIMK